MSEFRLDPDTTVNAAIYLLQRTGVSGYHKVFKLLYFADQYHLKQYGQPLTGDQYMAMKYGPVPSFLYDVFKAAEAGESPYAEAMRFSKYFGVVRANGRPEVKTLTPLDLDELSLSHVEALDWAIANFGGKSFNALTEASHDLAWTKADSRLDQEMSYLDIAEAAGTPDAMLAYIRQSAENARLNLA